MGEHGTPDERLTAVARAKCAAWDFLTGQGEVAGATLAEYLACAVAYACDETGHLLTRDDSPLPAAGREVAPDAPGCPRTSGEANTDD